MTKHNPPHDSAHKHVTGQAVYIDDIPLPNGTLHAYLGLSTCAHGRIIATDFTAVLAAKNVIGVLSAKDIIGVNDISPMGLNDEPVFADTHVEFYGQPIFAVIATDRNSARAAARLAKITYEPLPPAINIPQAITQNADYVTKPLKLERGDITAGFAKSAHCIKGQFAIGGQDHFYLEGHIALAQPCEDGGMRVYSSTQHPSEVQHMVAGVLGIAQNAVVVRVRRMGGGFGGKETQGNIFACVAAMAAQRYNRAVKLRPDRDDDMIMTGKRHDFLVDYQVGFDKDGRIIALDGMFSARCGFSADLSGPVTDRALFHADNAYYYPNVRLRSAPLKTNTVSNTAFRGFGGPQGLIAAERVIEEIAFYLNKDPMAIRRANFYGSRDKNNKGRDITPYHQKVRDNIAPQLMDELVTSCDYTKRRAAVLAHNAKGGVIRKGIAMTPVKFGISFTATWYNQAGALVHVYKDGSVMVNHGGTEMGQGLYTKVAQIVAEGFGIALSRVQITKTATDKIPNTSATAASSGTDLNAMAALNAVEKIKTRLAQFLVEDWGDSKIRAKDIVFKDGFVQVGEGSGGRKIAFDTLINAAYYGRIQLSATGFYKTPKIHWDRDTGRGHPFYYFAYGMAAAEVSVDSLSGEYKVLRVDILHDVGQSLNTAIDIGQIEGGFIQGMGWLTSEQLVWDATGRLRTHAPSTYKIPLSSDVPAVFNVALADWSRNKEPTIKRSKAVGEPPLMLAVSVFEAISMAVASVDGYKTCPRLNAPATPEEVLRAIERLSINR